MREKRQPDYTYNNDEYCSIFVGMCESKELLDAYLNVNYEMFECEYIASEFGVDFDIDIYDEDFFVAAINKVSSNQITDIFTDARVFKLQKLEELYPEGLEENYNTAIVIGRLKYEGSVKEIYNEEFGHFKFLGTFLDI